MEMSYYYSLTETEQRRRTQRIIIHPQYVAETEENDISLLKLVAPLNLDGRTVAPICLPPSHIRSVGKDCLLFLTAFNHLRPLVLFRFFTEVMPLAIQSSHFENIIYK